MGVAVVSVLTLFTWAGCSLVVDTDECNTDADCEYADQTQLACVARECVPVAETVNRQALMPSVIEKDLGDHAELESIADATSTSGDCQ